MPPIIKRLYIKFLKVKPQSLKIAILVGIMKKNLLTLLILLCAITGFSQSITVNPNANVPATLVTGLVSNSCLAQTSGAAKTTGETYGYTQGKSIAHFNNTNPNFPIMGGGVVLTTGNAVAAQGPNTNVSSFYDMPNAWVGDTDLETAFNSAGLPINSMNATVLEFDFVAATSNVSIPYVFASEEYGGYQCSSKDGFAILLKNTSSPGNPYINIATVGNDPVSVRTLRNSAYNANCASDNETFFGTFNGGGNASASATNFEGDGFNDCNLQRAYTG